MLLPFLLLAPTSVQDELAQLAVLDSVAANLAWEAYETSVAEHLAQHQAALDPLRARWRAGDAEYAQKLVAARASLFASLEEALGDAAKRADVDENLRIERALQALESGADLPVPAKFGRPARGAVAFGGHHYLYIDERLTWYAADARARELGGALAILETEEERTFAARFPKDWTWLGLSDAKVEGTWTWSDGSTCETEWEPGQPDNYGRWEHKGVLSVNGLLGDAHGEDPWPFLVEWGASVPAAWDFTFRAARKAKERYDKVARDAQAARAKARASVERTLAKPRKTLDEQLDDAAAELVDALDAAVEAEVRRGRPSIAVTLRAAEEAVARGEGRPPVPTLGSGIPPVDAQLVAGRAFKFLPGPVPWPEALAQCRALGGRLAVAADPAVRDHIRALSAQHGPLWLGASDAGDEGNWRWLDGRLVHGWLPNQPNNHNDWEHYLVTDANGVNDDHGEVRFGFVCEWLVD